MFIKTSFFLHVTLCEIVGIKCGLEFEFFV